MVYIRTFLYIFKRHRTILKMKKYKLFQDKCKFVGMDMEVGVKQPA